MGSKHRQNRLLPAVCDLAPKARKTFFYESSASESALCCISPPPRYLCGSYFKVTARTNHGNPAVLFSQRYKPHLANWQKLCLNSTFFRYSARSPHRATKPSRDWLWVAVRKPRLVLLGIKATRNKVTATHPCDDRGCIHLDLLAESTPTGSQANFSTAGALGPGFRRNLVSCGYGRGQNQTGLPNRNPKPIPAWLSGAMRRSRAITKNRTI